MYRHVSIWKHMYRLVHYYSILHPNGVSIRALKSNISYIMECQRMKHDYQYLKEFLRKTQPPDINYLLPLHKNIMGKRKNTGYGSFYGTNKKELKNGGCNFTLISHTLVMTEGRTSFEITQWPYFTHLPYALMGLETWQLKRLYACLGSLTTIQKAPCGACSNWWKIEYLTFQVFRPPYKSWKRSTYTSRMKNTH